ncbi:hypothetical protein NHH03_01585 [Stieleria sp. TO1_6]|uniref:hypothetical protein n=1 Tax=Stieleria tagensis TaxID=2956795 RepID=UPI00209AB588|nr:hypothetical protein [Stieleria tagensis]MCO8120411.1 hypothetical protein [Stieleria tagensis]
MADSPQAEILPSIEILSEMYPPQGGGDGRVALGDRLVDAGRGAPDGAWVPSQWGERVRDFGDRRRKPLMRLLGGVQAYRQRQARRDAGIGVERLPFALFEVDTSQPSNNFRVRFDAAYDWEFPDRAEVLWSKIGGKGPAETIPIESSVDYQDIRVAIEVGGKRFSATTELPLRFIDPTVVGNTGGMGDMVLTTKTLMMDGDSFQLTQVLRNQLPTGSARNGRGNGHTSMEPGFVARYSWSEKTMIHNELKLWFPLGGDPDFSGPVLRYGFGLANVLYDSDSVAVIPTLEFVGWSVLSGQKTVGLLQVQDIDGENIFNIYPGVRMVRDTGGGAGVFEFGISGGTSVSTSHWYESLMRMELRWTF